MPNRATVNASRWPWRAAASAAAVIFLAALFDCPSSARAADLSGTVKTSAGIAIPGVSVAIVRSGQRLGNDFTIIGVESSKKPGEAASLHAPKPIVTGQDGSFTVNGVDDAGLITLQFEAADYFPKTVVVAQRTSRPLNVILVSKQGKPDDAPNQITGQVLLPDDTPAVGALITDSRHQLTGPARNVSEAEALATTDAEGKYSFFSENAKASVTVTVDAPGTVTGKIFTVRPGRKGNTLRLIAGATISGRVLRNVKPVAGVTVGLVANGAARAEVAGIYEAATDADGRYTFHHVYPSKAFVLFTKMESLAELNVAAIRREIHSPGDGSRTELAELNLHPAHRVRGRLVFSDFPEKRPDVRVVLTRIGLPDSQAAKADAEGNFSFDAVPSESVSLSFGDADLSVLVGYRLSSNQPSIDPVQRTTLRGRVDEDVELAVILEPGKSPTELSNQGTTANVQQFVLQPPGAVAMARNANAIAANAELAEVAKEFAQAADTAARAKMAAAAQAQPLARNPAIAQRADGNANPVPIPNVQVKDPAGNAKAAAMPNATGAKEEADRGNIQNQLAKIEMARAQAALAVAKAAEAKLAAGRAMAQNPNGAAPAVVNGNVVIVQQNGARVVRLNATSRSRDPRLELQRRVDEAPLRGPNAEVLKALEANRPASQPAKD